MFSGYCQPQKIHPVELTDLQLTLPVRLPLEAERWMFSRDWTRFLAARRFGGFSPRGRLLGRGTWMAEGARTSDLMNGPSLGVRIHHLEIFELCKSRG